MGLGISEISIGISFLGFIDFLNLMLLILLGNLSPQMQTLVNKDWVIWGIKYVKEMVCEMVSIFFPFTFFIGIRSPCKSEKECTLLIYVALNTIFIIVCLEKTKGIYGIISQSIHLMTKWKLPFPQHWNTWIKRIQLRTCNKWVFWTPLKPLNWVWEDQVTRSCLLIKLPSSRTLK